MTSIDNSAANVAEIAPANSIKVRLATTEDAPWVEALQAICFGPGRFARAAFRVREQLPIDPSLSLIAEIDGERVASVGMTPISLSGSDGYLLGPLATDPAKRGRGAGRTLVAEVTRLALERDRRKYVLLVGDESYYGPLGFVKTTLGAIEFPGPVDPERVLVHCVDDALAGKLAGSLASFDTGL